MLNPIPTSYMASGTSTSHQHPLRHHRTVSYKLGVFGIVAGFCLFMTGFSTSHWIHTSNFTSTHQGTVFELTEDNSSHHDFIHWGLWNSPDFIKINEICNSACQKGFLISQVLFSIALAGYVVCFAVAAFENCRPVDVATYHSRKLELAVFVTGALGCSGMFVFIYVYAATLGFVYTMEWSLFMTSLSDSSMFLAWIFLMCGNKKPGVGVVISQPTNIAVAHYSRGQHQRDSAPQQPVFKPNVGYPQPCQPLLPQQPYPYPPPAYPAEAPPAYSFPPAYPDPSTTAINQALPPYEASSTSMELAGPLPKKP